MAGGAYLSAKKGAMLFVSKQRCRSAGPVCAMEGGPRMPDEVTHTSTLCMGARGVRECRCVSVGECGLD